MIDTALVASIAQQMMSSNTVDVNGKAVPVSRTSKNRFRTLAFLMGGREYMAIEQNAEKPSRWGKLAREGHQVVQFKDSATNRFVVVCVDGVVTIYGAGYGSRKRRNE
jgi:hypothetical protein